MSEFELTIAVIGLSIFGYYFFNRSANITTSYRPVHTNPSDFQQDIVHAEAPKEEVPDAGAEPATVNEYELLDCPPGMKDC